MYQKSQSYDVQFLKDRVRQRQIELFVILGHFYPFTPPPLSNYPENQNFEKKEKKKKKIPGDIIFLYIHVYHK